jgi:hypothetical protein
MKYGELIYGGESELSNARARRTMSGSEAGAAVYDGCRSWRSFVGGPLPSQEPAHEKPL